jgi:hypothetical protein
MLETGFNAEYSSAATVEVTDRACGKTDLTIRNKEMK